MQKLNVHEKFYFTKDYTQKIFVLNLNLILWCRCICRGWEGEGGFLFRFRSFQILSTIWCLTSNNSNFTDPLKTIIFQNIFNICQRLELPKFIWKTVNMI